jgi:uncharacterized repeat protein (TIGR01451 family)
MSPLNTVVFSGASPGPLTFNVSLNCGSLDDCCSFPVKLVLPECDCAQVIGESAPSCGFPNPSTLTYTIKLQNLSTHVVENLVVVPVSPNDHVTPVPPSSLTVTHEINPVTPAGQGGIVGPVTVRLSGSQAVPGNQVCLSLGLLEKDFRDCCSIVRCFRIPDCHGDSTSVHPVGEASITAAGSGFRIDHIGSTGDDGISIDLKDADKGGLAWLPLDAAGERRIHRVARRRRGGRDDRNPARDAGRHRPIRGHVLDRRCARLHDRRVRWDAAGRFGAGTCRDQRRRHLAGGRRRRAGARRAQR